VAIYRTSIKTIADEQAGCNLPGRTAQDKGSEDGSRLAIRPQERRGLRTAATIYYSLTVLSFVNVDAQTPVAQGIGATTYARVGFRGRVSSLP
jgi:hypothetical protein